MKLEWNRKYTTIAVYAFLVCAASIVFYLIFSDLKTFGGVISRIIDPIMPIIYGFVVAYLLNPIMVSIENSLMKREIYSKMSFSYRRSVSMVLTYIITVSVLTVMLVIVLPKVAVNIANMYSQLQSYVLLTEKSVTMCSSTYRRICFLRNT